jgi:transposase-like protein
MSPRAVGHDLRTRRTWRLRRAARLRRRFAQAVAEGESVTEVARRFGVSPEAARRFVADGPPGS